MAQPAVDQELTTANLNPTSILYLNRLINMLREGSKRRYHITDIDSVISLLNKASKSTVKGAHDVLREFLLSLDEEVKEALIHRGLFISDEIQNELKQAEPEAKSTEKESRGILLLNSLRRKTQKI